MTKQLVTIRTQIYITRWSPTSRNQSYLSYHLQKKYIFFANKSDINQLPLTYFNGNRYFSTYNNEILNVFAEDTVVKNTIVFIKNIEYQTFKGSRNDDLIYLLKANKLTQTFFLFFFAFCKLNMTAVLRILTQWTAMLQNDLHHGNIQVRIDLLINADIHFTPGPCATGRRSLIRCWIDVNSL